MVGAGRDAYEDPLARAHELALDWLGSLDTRAVPPAQSVEAVLAAVGGPLPAGPTAPTAVVEQMARSAEPGLMAIQSGRFFGWVMGGTLPAALAADWLVGAWDQNAGMRSPTPGVVALEETAGTWFLDLLGLPADAAVSFTTGATMANFVGLASARHAVLAGVGWDVEHAGSTARPRCTCSPASNGTTASTSRCGTWVSVHPPSWRRTRRDVCGSTPWRRLWTRCRTGRR